MIPSKLRLTNFMCYRGTTEALDFDQFEVVCITGENGNGKSALLEAITWVVWGKTKVLFSKDLITKGENDMLVDFEFFIDYISDDSELNNKYKIIRSIRTKSGGSILDLQQFDGSNYVSISGDTISETQKQIINLVNMDYETFVNTSYLMQGNADRFTTSKPDERKDILSAILNLDHYQNLADFTRNILRNTDSYINANNILVDRTRLEISDLDPGNNGTDFIEKEIINLNQKIESLNKQKLKLQQNLQLNNKYLNEISDFQSKKQLLSSSYENNIDMINNLNDLLLKDNELLIQSDNILDRYNDAITKQKELDDLYIASSKYQDINNQLNTLQNELDFRMNELEIELRSLSKNRNVLDKKINQDKFLLEDNQKNLSDYRSKITELNKLNENYLNLINKFSDEITQFKNKLVTLQTSNKDHENKLDLLQKEHKTCPLCKSGLNDETKKSIVFDLNNKIQLNIKDINNNKSKLDESEKEFFYIQDKYKKTTKSLTDLNSTINLVNNDCIRIKKEIDENINQILSYKNLMNDTKYLYENDIKIKVNKNKIWELNLLLDDLKFDQDRFSTLINEVPDFKTESEKNFLLLNQSEERIKENKVKLNTLNIDSLIIKDQIKALEKNIKNINQIINSLNIKSDSSENIDFSLDDFKKTLILKQNSLNYLISKKNYLDEILINNKELYIKSEDLKFLELSFSRNGIQALIIENVLPSLELEANKLLSYLTENKLSINLQIRKGRRLKNTEDFSQEIDIIIADENGAVREYETYSGGESFRIDFAIRIALSRLVSLRSGVRSPILFIDEGFGSQDQIGQDRLREAIQKVSNSENYKFKKIIVITHLESLKESFGVALEVSKNESSSYFSLN